MTYTSARHTLPALFELGVSGKVAGEMCAQALNGVKAQTECDGQLITVVWAEETGYWLLSKPAAGWHAGDRVRYAPKYGSNRVGTVIGHGTKWVTVVWDGEPDSRWRTGPECLVKA